MFTISPCAITFLHVTLLLVKFLLVLHNIAIAERPIKCLLSIPYYIESIWNNVLKELFFIRSFRFTPCILRMYIISFVWFSYYIVLLLYWCYLSITEGHVCSLTLYSHCLLSKLYETIHFPSCILTVLVLLGSFYLWRLNKNILKVIDITSISRWSTLIFEVHFVFIFCTDCYQCFSVLFF